MVSWFAAVHLIVQVCTAAGNLLAGNTTKASQSRMLQFFSQHIAAEEFDPTGDVVSQLEALDACKPSPIPDLGEVSKFIEKQIMRITQRDNKLRQKGKTWLFKHLCSFDKPLTYFERCITVNSNYAGMCSTVLQTAGPLCHHWLPSVHHQAAVQHDVTGRHHPRSTALR
jgi:hypothetical protein